MAKLYITEFADVMHESWGNTPVGIPMNPALAYQQIAIGATHAECSALNVATKVIRVHTDAICSIAIGASAVATALMSRMVAGQTEYYAVPQGASYIVSVITAS